MLIKLTGFWCVVLFLGMTSSVAAAERIYIMALFKDKVVINIDGAKHTLAIGHVSPEGVKLISADSTQAVLEVGGKRTVYPLGGAVSIGTYSVPAERIVRIFPDRRGMYYIQGSINRYPVKFLVDTGATTVAMNAEQARRLGIDFKLRGKPVPVATASGVTKGYAIGLDTVKVGEIQLHNIAALVIDGDYPKQVLLGMSFLGKVAIERDGRVMRLKKKW